MWEEPEACAERETFEETGLVVKAIAHGPTTDDRFLEERKHYKTLHIWCKMVDETAEPEVSETTPATPPFVSPGLGVSEGDVGCSR